MNDQLKTFCRKNEYRKILAYLKAGCIKKDIFHRNHKINDVDKQEIATFVESKILYCLHSNENVPNDLVLICVWLGEKSVEKTKKMIESSLISEILNRYCEFVKENFKSLNDLQLLYKNTHETIYKFGVKYYTFPKEWNMHLVLFCKILLVLKKHLTKYFYEKSVEEDEFALGFMETVAFEQKLHGFLKENLCCNAFDQNSNNKCIHFKMLSSIFLPKILLFFNFHLKGKNNKEYDQTKIDQGIISHFTQFFKKAQVVLEKILHFDDDTCMKGFMKAIDFYLLEMIKNVYLEQEIDKMLIVLNTINFINQTCKDMEFFINKKYDMSNTLKIYKYTQQLEQLQMKEFDTWLSKTFVGPNLQNTESSVFIQWYVSNISFNKHTNIDSKLAIVEHVMAHLFVQIASIKYDKETCEKMIDYIGAIESFLQTMHRQIPHIKTMKNFLKILMFPQDNSENFIQNFVALSASNFTFHQILKAFKNQKYSAALFMAYKKITGRKK